MSLEAWTIAAALVTTGGTISPAIATTAGVIAFEDPTPPSLPYTPVQSHRAYLGVAGAKGVAVRYHEHWQDLYESADTWAVSGKFELGGSRAERRGPVFVMEAGHGYASGPPCSFDCRYPTVWWSSLIAARVGYHGWWSGIEVGAGRYWHRPPGGPIQENWIPTASFWLGARPLHFFIEGAAGPFHTDYPPVALGFAHRGRRASVRAGGATDGFLLDVEIDAGPVRLGVDVRMRERAGSVSAQAKVRIPLGPGAKLQAMELEKGSQ